MERPAPVRICVVTHTERAEPTYGRSPPWPVSRTSSPRRGRHSWISTHRQGHARRRVKVGLAEQARLRRSGGRLWMEPSATDRPAGRLAQPSSAAAQLALAWRSAAAQTCLVSGPKLLWGPFMSHPYVQPPDLFPILSPGKHRNPRAGACFMELASLLAGERWSDHPACTHPLLAALARHLNAHPPDTGRQRLTPLVPSVIGLTGANLHIDARIALRSATMALPVVGADRKRVMAASGLRA